MKKMKSSLRFMAVATGLVTVLMALPLVLQHTATR